MAKAFIFSIDAFVAFTFVLIMIHSLIFIAAVPSSYYGGLTQANYLARDTVAALAAANSSKLICDPADSGYNECVSDYSQVTLLDYLMRHRDADTIRAHVGALIPEQYGYALELWDSGTGSWTTLYDSADYDYSEDPHAKSYHKLMVSSHSLFFGYDSDGARGFHIPYCYITCNPGSYGGCPTPCDEPVSNYDEGQADLGLVRLTVYR